MNNLSWFLYLADVVYQQLALLITVAICVPVGYLLIRIFSKLWADDLWPWDEKEVNDRKREERKKPFITTFKPFIFAAVVLLLVNLVPSKDTFYLIAASEAGEMVVNTPEANEIMSDLKEILSIQLDKLKQ